MTGSFSLCCQITPPFVNKFGFSDGLSSREFHVVEKWLPNSKWECGNILDRLHGIAQASPSPRYRVVHLAPAFVERLEPAVHVPFDVGVELRPELVEPHLRPVAAVVELLLQRPEEAFGAGVVGAAPPAGHGARDPALLAYPLPGGGPVRRPADLCQDFGHGSSRIYAAMGSSSAAGFVRSKKASMAFAGIW